MPANKKEANPEDYPLISNATVNRSTIEVLKKLFTFAKRAGARFDQEPDWKRFMLEEAEERVRELNGDEGERIETAIDDHYADYAPYFAFLHASGLRRNECLLRWLEIDWEKGEISLKGKGKRTVRCMITPTIRAILSPLRDHHPEWVFTYSAQRTRDGRVAGRRYPLTMNGVKTAWKRLRAKSGVVDFRLHDFRHDLGTKLLRKTGNLKLVSKVLNHRDLKTTMRYAHVLDADVTEALESVTRRDVKLRKKLRNKPAVGG